MRKTTILIVLAVFCLAVPSAQATVNKSIRIADGEHINNNLKSVNGSITIGEECVIRGKSSTVNGSIRVGRSSEVRTLSTVNGRITVRKNTTVDGRISTVNGSISCESGVEVEDEIKTVNGSVSLDNTGVLEDVTTNNGQVRVENGSRVGGDIIIRKNNNPFRFLFPKRKKINIYVTDGSVVRGSIINYDKYKDVKVYLDSSSRIEGDVEGAKVIRR